MSKPKKLPLPLEEMISRAEVKKTLGLNSHQMCYVTKFSPDGYPECIYRGPNKRMFYNRKDMEQWIAKHEHDVLSLIPKNLYELNEMSDDDSAFDNKTAVNFLRQMPVDVVPMFKGIGGATKRVTLKERNDYTPPRSELTLYGNNGNHQLHVAGVY